MRGPNNDFGWYQTTDLVLHDGEEAAVKCGSQERVVTVGG